jgi:hypothetical protein
MYLLAGLIWLMFSSSICKSVNISLLLLSGSRTVYARFLQRFHACRWADSNLVLVFLIIFYLSLWHFFSRNFSFESLTHMVIMLFSSWISAPARVLLWSIFVSVVPFGIPISCSAKSKPELQLQGWQQRPGDCFSTEELLGCSRWWLKAFLPNTDSVM